MEIISSKDNKKIKYIRSLLEKGNIRKKNHQFVVEGIKLVDEALEYGKVLEIVLNESLYKEIISGDLSKNALLAENGKNITNYVKKGYSTIVVSDAVFKTVSETISPQGAAAVIEMPEYELLAKEFLNQAYNKNGKIKLLILEDTADPGNLGTIMRTAEAAGVTGVIMSKAIKYSDRSAILVGNEARGLSDETANLADTYVLIPMQGKVESLNAAVAAALMMYEV